MTKKHRYSSFILGICILLCSCNKKCYDSENTSNFGNYAQQILDSIYSKYGVKEEKLLRENYPFAKNNEVTYLNSGSNQSNKFSYLWPFSGTFSGTLMLYKITQHERYLELIEKRVLPALDEYYDAERYPAGYSSYISRAPLSDRFYDDNIWIGIDFVDLFLLTNNPLYLDKAEKVWTFVDSGYDDQLGGGIYWVEQDKKSKHTCSNAPAAVLAAKLYAVTQNKDYLEKSISLYSWTKERLQDKDDLLYYDNINIEGHVDKKKYSYNSGQMLQTAVLLYKETQSADYLKDAKELAEACRKYFFTVDPLDSSKAIIKDGDIWFSAIMARGFVELYHVDNNPTYIKSINQSLNYAWNNMRDQNGLFVKGWDSKIEDTPERWLLSQAAMVELYARFSCIDVK